MEFTTNDNGIPADITDGIQNDWFKIELVKDEQDKLTAFRATALQDYDSSHALDAIKVSFGGRLEFELSIEQVDQSQNGWDDGGGQEEDL
jgi:hypothetical protein